jgi:hypothetical protein
MSGLRPTPRFLNGISGVLLSVLTFMMPVRYAPVPAQHSASIERRPRPGSRGGGQQCRMALPVWPASPVAWPNAWLARRSTRQFPRGLSGLQTGVPR